MTEKELFERLKTVLYDRLWEPGGEPVFPSGSVVVTAGPAETAMDQLRSPIVMFRPGNGRSDEQEPGFLKQTIDAVLIIKVTGDKLGEFAIMDGAVPEPLSSLGKGLLSIQHEFYEAIKELTRVDSVVIEHRARSAMVAQMMDTGYHVQRGYRMEAWLNA